VTRRAPLLFKQSDVSRALRATHDAGYEAARLRIVIEIDIGKPAAAEACKNEWDEVLARDPPAT
jgi:hypothetical protein